MWVKWTSRDGSVSHADIPAEGSGYCHVGADAFNRWVPADEYGAYCVLADGARIRIARSKHSDPVMTGALLLERLER